jgi:hypothetical protein
MACIGVVRQETHMRMRWTAFGGIGSLLAAWWWFCPTPDAVLGERSAPYFEDALPPRPVAWVHASLERHAGVVRLRLVVDAEGPGVDPVPGMAGVAGANLHTADDLRRLLDERALTVHTRPTGRPGVVWPGMLRVQRTGTLPTRRFGANGELELDARTAASYPLAVEFLSAPLPVGEHDTYVEVDGLPRLRVGTACDGRGGSVLAIESVGEPDPFRRQQ